VGRATTATIQINGRTYDAITGKLVSETRAAQAKPAKPKAKSIPHRSGHSIEGVVRAKTPASHSRHSSKAVHARTKRARTLHRAAVKPAKASAQSARSSAAAAPSAHQPDTERLARAKRVHKSKAITKFGSGSSAVGQTIPPVTELTPPTLSPAVQAAPAQLSPKEELIAKRLAQVAATSAANPKVKAHHRVKNWLKNPRRSTVLATSASALLLVGYITYINIPNMALRVAASRAGFAASLPGYQPPGFHFNGPVAYQPGEITVSYVSADSRSYTITQKESNWDSQTLLDHIEPQAELYPATYQESGLTVYVYDGQVATWVNAGVWYTVNNEAGQLTTEQMLKIAASL
jgi:hypothetical protein